MTDQTFPSWRYGPKGEASVFQSAADVPEGWKEAPFAPPPAEPEGEPDGDAQVRIDTRDGEIIASLQARLALAEAERDRLAGEVAKMDPDGDGKVGGFVPKPPAEPQPTTDDPRTDEELREAVKDKTGRAPRPNTGREKLLEKLKDAD